MNQERYWRNLLADEIKAEHDKVRLYYEKRGMNNGGMSPEEHTRLNIFLLCESIVRTMKDSQDAPRLDTPNFTPAETVKATFSSSTVEPVVEDNEIDGQISMEDISPVPDFTPDNTPDPVHSLVKNTPYQNEFGELL